ncbi:cysteine hydrolase family protein [Tunicatimonas pelagia]|uniref:cysteine hydrolase family protein n=1 Tax=Tunicatimonas pelagia TaxID=931531 RepID=UPI002666B34E|nr:isochorismatase family cysteine hydrolase [Tunicatimonas pelagia]WKN41028.1 cysteine hydrolase [Tunicatimonas pelagia]
MKRGTIKKVTFSIVGLLLLFVIIVFVNFKIFEKHWSDVSLGQPIAHYGERRAALLVIDVQEGTTGYVSRNAFYKENADSLISIINRIADIFKASNALVVYARSEISNPLINLLDNSYAKGSIGANFDRRLKLKSDLEVVKVGNDTFADTNLDSILISNKISDLYMVGLDAAYCIDVTSEAAQNRNYRINLIEEAILSESEATKDGMMADFRNRGIEVVNFNNIKIAE